jgi:hypothetical protein
LPAVPVSERLTGQASPTASIDRSDPGLQGDQLSLNDDDNDPGGGHNDLDDDDDFGDDDDNNDDGDFGDDFDDFEEGQEVDADDDDFGEFDEGFQQSQSPQPPAPTLQQQPPSLQPSIVSKHYMHDTSCSNEQTAIEMIYLTDDPDARFHRLLLFLTFSFASPLNRTVLSLNETLDKGST